MCHTVLQCIVTSYNNIVCKASVVPVVVSLSHVIALWDDSLLSEGNKLKVCPLSENSPYYYHVLLYLTLTISILTYIHHT